MTTVTEYHARGLCCIPLRSRTKKAAISWKRFQARRPSDVELSQMFAGDGAELNVGIVCGSVSAGGLVVRDFDDRGAFDRWRNRFPAEAAKLPTVETARGGHVYGRTDPEAFLRLTGGRSIVGLGDGELRGGGYVLAPPSVHPDGHVYRWTNPLGDRLPDVDPKALEWLPDGSDGNSNAGKDLRRNLAVSESESGTYSNSSTLGAVEGSSCPPIQTADDLSKKLWKAIKETLPTGPGERNRAVLALARRLRGLPEFVNGGPAHAEPVLAVWFRQALPVIRSKNYAETLREFCGAWKGVRFPTGDGFLPFALWQADQRGEHRSAKRYSKPREASLRRLVGWLAELDRIMSGRFWLAIRDAAELLAVGKSTAARMMQRLRSDGVLRLIESGTRKRSPHYRFSG